MPRLKILKLSRIGLNRIEIKLHNPPAIQPAKLWDYGSL